MPLCVKCGKPLGCGDCSSSHDLGGVGGKCVAKDGAVWVHVMDDAGNGLEAVEVQVAGAKKKTDKSGFAAFDPMDAGKYTAALSPLSGGLAEGYDPPPDTEAPVSVTQGEIAYVKFELARRAALKVEVVKKGERTKVFGEATVTVKGKENPPEEKTRTVDGIADFKRRSAGEYTIEVALKPDDAKDFFTPLKPVEITLAPGDDKTVTIEAEAVNVVTPKIEMEYKVVLVGRDLAKHQDGKEAPILASPTYIQVSFEQTNDAYPYEEGAELSCDPQNVTVYLDEKCEDKDKLTGALTKEQLKDGEALKLYLKGAKPGKFKVKLKLKDPSDKRIRVDKNPAEAEMGAVELALTLYKQNEADPFAHDVELSDEAKVKVGRMLHVQASGKSDHARAKLVVKKLEGSHFPDGCDEYKIALRAENTHGETEIYDAETGGNVKAYPVEIAKSDLVGGDKTFWVQGKASTKGYREIVIDAGLDRKAGGLPKKEKRNGDWARFTVVEIEEVKPSSEFAAPTTDYDNDKFQAHINEASDPDGRKIKIKAKLKEKLKDVKIHFMLAAHKDNGKVANNKVDLPGALPDALKHVDRDKTGSKPHLSALTDADGCAEVELTLSRVGGDVFFAGAYIAEEPSFTKYVHEDTTWGVKKPVLSKKLTVWRKVYYQISHRNTLAIPGRAGFLGAMREVFIEPVEVINAYDPSLIGGLTTHKRSMIDPDTHGTGSANDDIVVVGSHNKATFYGQFTAHGGKRPRCHVIVIDAQWDPMKESRTDVSEYDFESLTDTLSAEDSKGNEIGIFNPTLGGQPIVKSGTWKWKKHKGDITDAMITIPGGRSDTDEYELTLPSVCPPTCPCGAPGTAIAPTKKSPAKVKIEVRGADGPYAGESGSKARPHILVEVDAEAEFNDSLAHELGHMFAEVSKARHGTSWADHPNQYVKRGGTGPHCKLNAGTHATETDEDGNKQYTAGTCIMFHEGSSNQSMHFCSDCSINLLIRDNSEFA